MKHKLFIIILLFSFCSGYTQDTAAIRLNNYRDKVFAVFNSCSLQDDAVTNAIKIKNVTEIEAGRKALLQCAIDGIKKLDTLENFYGDPALKFGCRDVLKFYKQLAESDFPLIRDFFIIEENFMKIKQEFKKKPARKYSETEIYAYNTEAKKYNEAVTRYIQLNNFIAASRKLTLYNWYSSEKIFMQAHKAK